MSDLQQVEFGLIDGTKTTFGEISKPVTLVVNVASRCGLTPQYAALEELQRRYGPDKFTVLGVPSNQFKQESGTEAEISTYCATNWGVTFPLTEKMSINGRKRHPLYETLVLTPDSSGKAGRVQWNFEKFLVTPTGVQRFRPRTVPDDPEIVAAIRKRVS